MNRLLKIKSQQNWLFLAVIIILSLTGCNSEKRATRALMRLDAKGKNVVRPWPQNYTFEEYCKMMDSSRFLNKLYKSREDQAQKVGDKRTADIMNYNVKQYKKKIKHLKNDKRFYKIYRLNDKKINAQLKESEKAVKRQKKQKVRQDNTEKKRQKEFEKRSRKNIKENQKRLDDKKKRLENNKNEYAEQVNSYHKTIEDKQEELNDIQEIANDPENRNDATLKEAIDDLTRQIKTLKYKKQELEKSLESVTTELDQFVEKYYSPKEEEKKKDKDSQMILRTDPIQLQTPPDNHSDSIP